MSSAESYMPAAAFGAEIEQSGPNGEQWALVLVRTLSHAPPKVWKALTDPEQLRQWAPFDASRNLGTVGTATLTTVGTPSPMVSESRITRADAPHLLEFSWGGQEIRWKLEPQGKGTRLTLWHNIDRRFIAMGAAGWHVCLDVMDRSLAGQPIGRLVAGDALQHPGWQRLHAEYKQQFNLE